MNHPRNLQHPELIPRLAHLVRLLMQLRVILSCAALLLLPGDRITPATVLLTVLFSALTVLIAVYWERVTPYILRHPFLVTADVFIAAAILSADGPRGPFFVATVLTATAAGLLFTAFGATVVVAFQTVCYFASLVLYSAHSAISLESLVDSIFTVQVLTVHPLLYIVAAYVGAQLRKIFVHLDEEQRRREAAETRAAAADERARLARDMHDSVAKTLRGAAMAAQALPLWLKKDPERAAKTADQVVAAAETAAMEARELISDLREEASSSPIESIAQLETEAWSASTGVEARFHAELQTPDPPLSVIARHELVAILREALTNVDRHSEANSVEVLLTTDTPHHASEPSLRMRVADDGRGIDLSDDGGMKMLAPGVPYYSGHFGFVGMHERALRAAGSFEVESRPGHGTAVILTLPLIGASDTDASSHRDAERST